ncbi:unnamed protein product [Pleuronectes platessa]|uniref:PDZ domain-containing protein n=1 Tax=Pleuronectes platessa TaxID=8262 RepID=A0A9N7W3D9_PLEPL|nr:unnamed protein product [Pleuronectes platessa]
MALTNQWFTSFSTTQSPPWSYITFPLLPLLQVEGAEITPGSKAAQGNLIQGDVIVAIDGVGTDGMTHLEAQNKIKMANYNLALTMSKSKRPIMMPPPRMDGVIPMIPHQQPQSVHVNGRLSACSPSSGPAEADSPGRRVGSPAQRKVYNSPIGLYSEETLREMAAIQEGRPAGDIISSLSPFPPSLLHSTFHLFPPSITARPLHMSSSTHRSAGFNPATLSTHNPIEVKGPGGKATIIHAQYNTPISLYSQDAIMDTIAGQTQNKGHDAGTIDRDEKPFTLTPPPPPPPPPPAAALSRSHHTLAVQSAERDRDVGEWGQRGSTMQSKTFRVLAHMTGTESLTEDEEQEALRSSSPTEHAPTSASSASAVPAVQPLDHAPCSPDPAPHSRKRQSAAGFNLQHRAAVSRYKHLQGFNSSVHTPPPFQRYAIIITAICPRLLLLNSSHERKQGLSLLQDQ